VSGKGDKRRPTKVDKAEADANWDRIFGKEKWTACAECGEEIIQARVGDESFDYCEWCEQIVEGNTTELHR